MDKKSKINFLIGLVLGINLSVVTFNLYNMNHAANDTAAKYKKDDKQQVELATVKEENDRLKEEIASLKSSAGEQHSQLNDADYDASVYESTETVALDITDDMSYESIADLLVQNGVYSYKNDLLMVIELLQFNRHDFSQVMQKYGIISSADTLDNMLKQIETRSSAVAGALYTEKLIQDKKAFMKLIYLADINRGIKYGKKTFKKNSSLREICDVLSQM